MRRPPLSPFPKLTRADGSHGSPFALHARFPQAATALALKPAPASWSPTPPTADADRTP